MSRIERGGRTAEAYEAALEQNVVQVLGSVTIDAILDAPTVWKLFTCPAGFEAIITEVIAHSNTATLAGMIDVNFGGGAAAITPVWLDAADLSSMTSANMMLKLEPAGAVVNIDGDDATIADRSFVAEVVAGSTGAANVTLDVIGYLLAS